MNDTDSALMDMLMDIAEEMIGGGERIPGATFDAAAALLPAPCDQEEIAALALVALLTEHGRVVIRAGDLMAKLSRRSPVRPRWDVVLPRLANKGLLHLSEETEVEAEGGAPASHGRGRQRLRELTVALLFGSEAGAENDMPDAAASATPRARQRGYAGNREYLEDCFEYIERLHDELAQQDPPSARASARRRGRTRGDDGQRGDTVQEGFSTDVEARLRAIRRKAEGTAFELPLETLRTRHHLDDREWHILLHLLRNMMLGEGTEIKDFMLFFGGSAFARYDMQKFFGGGSALLRDGIIEVEDSRNFMRCDVEIAERHVDWLITGVAKSAEAKGSGSTADTTLPFASNEEYLQQWLDFSAEGFKENRRPHPFMKARGRVASLALAATPEFRILRARSEASLASDGGAERFPLEALISSHGLDDIERLILVAGLQGALAGHWIDIPDVLPMLAANVCEVVRLQRYFRRESRIVAKDLIDIRDVGIGTPDFMMNPVTMQKVVGGEDDAGEGTLLESDIFTEVRPRHTLDALQLLEAERTRLESAVHGVSREVCARLESWGVRGVTASRAPSSLLLLFSGGPGTGKTFAAEALAGTLGRTLLVTDISRLLSKWVGDSQQNVARLFEEYRTLCTRRAEAPVLLLNECDQFLSRRSAHDETSVDRMYHQMQNLFLENLESFPGILVATTNLPDALDEAFDRRFDEKIVFPLPDAAVRVSLWEAHLPADVPRLGDLDLRRLAARHSFSGGQIAVAAANALRRAALRGDGLRMEDLEEACVNENGGGCVEVVGFRV